MRETIALVLASMLFVTTNVEARADAARAVPSGRAAIERGAALKEKILEVPTGTLIEVRLLNKQKIRGRLGEVTDEAFSLATVQDDKIVSQKVAFNDLRSFKTVGDGKGKGHIVLYMLAGIGALVVVLIIVGIASGG